MAGYHVVLATLLFKLEFVFMKHNAPNICLPLKNTWKIFQIRMKSPLLKNNYCQNLTNCICSGQSGYSDRTRTTFRTVSDRTRTTFRTVSDRTRTTFRTVSDRTRTTFRTVYS